MSRSRIPVLILILLLIVFTFVILSLSSSAATIVDDDITENTTWSTARSPYLIKPLDFWDDITVIEGITLDIQPGVKVLFDNMTGLIIEGRLLAHGIATNPIILELNGVSSEDTKWRGVTLRSSNNIIEFCVISGTSYGIKSYEPNQTIRNCEFNTVYSAAIVLDEAARNVSLRNLTMSGSLLNGFTGISIRNIGSDSGILIEDVSMSDINRGINADWTDDIIIRNVSIINTPYGCSLQVAKNITISHLEVSNCSRYGILGSSQFLGLSNSTFSNVTIRAVELSVDSSIIDCRFIGNDLGMEVKTRSSVKRCTFKDNNVGMLVNGHFIEIMWNTFVTNGVHAQLKTSDRNATWDNGTHGNHWDNHTSPDTDSDGIVDIPMVLSPNNIDHYPQTEPVDYLSPIADAGPDRTVELNSVVKLDSKNSTDDRGIIVRTWRVFTDQSIITLHGEEAEFFAESIGSFTVELVVKDTCFNIDRDWFVLTVKDIQPPTFHLEDDFVYTTEVLSVSLNHTLWTDDDPDFPEGANFSWQLSWDDDWVFRWGEDVTLEVPNLGYYPLMYIAYDASGNKASGEILIFVDWRPPNAVPPTADAGEDLKVEVFTVVSLQGSYELGDLPVVQTQWTIGTDPPIIEEGTTVLFGSNEVGVYELIFQVWDYMNNTAMDIVSVAVVPRPPEVYILESPPIPVSDRVTVTGNVTADVEVIRVQYRIDGGDWVLANGTDDWSFELDPTRLEDGQHTLEVRVWDGYKHGTIGPQGFTVYHIPEGNGGTEEEGTNWYFIGLLVGLIVIVIAVTLIIFLRYNRNLRPE